MSVLDVEEEGWLGEKWNDIVRLIPDAQLGWHQAKVNLESVIWMNIHDGVGRQTYEGLMERRTPR